MKNIDHIETTLQTLGDVESEVREFFEIIVNDIENGNIPSINQIEERHHNMHINTKDIVARGLSKIISTIDESGLIESKKENTP